MPQFTLASDDEASLPAVAAMLEKERARGGAQNATSAVVLNASGLSAVQAFSSRHSLGLIACLEVPN